MLKTMDWNLTSISLCPIFPMASNVLKCSSITLMAHSSTRICYRKIPKNLHYPRRSKLPPDFGVNLFLKKPQTDSVQDHSDDLIEEEEEEEQIEENNGEIVWEAEEIEAITSLFRGRIPQKPGKLGRERPLPLPVPYKLRPLGLPEPKKHVPKQVSLRRASISSQIYKNPSFLIGLAKEVKRLSPDQDVSVVLDNCSRYLHKGSLSLTIRELGHLGLPERALQTFCWVQKQPRLFPDDRVLASTVEVLARNRDLKVPFNLEKFTNLSSRGVIEAMVKGLIRGGSLKLAWKLISVAKDGKRMLDPTVYAKIILELGKNPDKHVLAEALLDELAEREDLNLSQQDCTGVMKVCIKLGRFEAVESLFNWFRQSGHDPSVVMYTTLIHSRYSESKYREALAVVWEMEGSDCLFDLTAYRVVMKLFVALNDLPRAARYFSKLKEAGLSPTYDIYRNLITLYMVSGRLAKCKEMWKEAEMAGFKFSKEMAAGLLQLQRETRGSPDLHLKAHEGQEKPLE